MKFRNTVIKWRFRPSTEQRLILVLEWILGGTAIAAVVAFVADYGFDLTPENRATVEFSYAIIGGTVLTGLFGHLLIRRDRWEYLRDNKIKYLLSLLILIDMIGVEISRWFGQTEFSDVHPILFKLYILLNTGRKFLRLIQYLAQYNMSPARFIAGSFASVILTGAGLLWLLPKATTGSLHPVDALFTATSAVCVTGLIVVDTATAYTRLGQTIILGLIQIGGLGMMTVTAFFTMLIGQRMSGREQLIIGNVFTTERSVQLSSIVRTMAVMTGVIELGGFLSLYLSWKNVFGPGEAWYPALFHSISAFCNAGFSTFSDNLIRFVTHIQVNLTVCGLIILGGLGSEPLHNLVSLFRQGSIRRKTPRLSLHSKVVLIVTGFLLTFGTFLFLVLERSYSLKEFSWGQQLLASFFQSVTPRTAGFNTVDFSHVRPSTLMFGMLLMFIGAGPGSTGGGIKVTTLAILLWTVISAARGRTRLELFHRAIPVKVLYQTIVVITVYLSVVIVVSFLLSITENYGQPLELVFETVSALGTVGLSAGVTPHLSVVGKLLIIATMFVGRIGAFTLALAIGQRQLTESYRYPEEEVQIG